MFAAALRKMFGQRMTKWGNFIILFALTMAMPFSTAKAANQPWDTQGEPIDFSTNTIGTEQLAAGAYFVATTGSDSNPGTQARPWKTFAKATKTVTAGKTVYVRGGVYTQVLSIYPSGTADKPIRFLAYPGEKPVIEGNNQLPSSYSGLITVKGDWVMVDGFEVRNSRYLGVGLFGKHDIAARIFAHHSQKSGILISGDYGTVGGSKAWRNSLSNELGKGSSWSTGIVAARDTEDGLTEHAVIRQNHVWENWGQGISTYESNATVITDNVSHDNFSTNIYLSDTTNTICQRNFVYMNPQSYVFGYGSNVGIMMGDEKYKPASANNTVINNVAYGNKRNFYWWQGDGGGGLVNTLIANNTFVNSVAIDGVQINQGTHQNTRFVNNIIQQDGSLPVALIAKNAELQFSNNIWSKTPPAAAAGTGNLVKSPGLAKTGSPFSANWYQLTSTSPAVNKALVLPQVRVDHKFRTRVSPPDIGAWEYIPAP